MQIIRRVLFLIVLAGFARAAYPAGELPEALEPHWTIPMVSTPPTIDGNISPGEWDQAVSATGLVDFLSRYMVARQAQVWLTADSQYLYVAMRSPLPGYGKLVAGQKRNDVRWVFQDDAIEVVIDPPGDAPGESQFEALHHMIFNSLDTVYDIKRCKGIGQNFLNWNTGADRANHVGNGVWEWEARFPAGDFGLKAIRAGETWRIAIVRNWKNPNSWASITPGYACSTPTTYVRAHLVKDATIFQFDHLGDPRDGKLDLQGTVRGKGETTVTATILSWPEMKPIAERSITVTATPAGQSVRLQREFEMAPSNLLQIRVAPKGGEPVFRHAMLFKRMTPDEAQAIAQWNQPPKPRTQFQAQRYHFPSRGTLEVEVDFADFVDANRVAALSAAVPDARVQHQQAPLDADRRGAVTLDVGKLPVGKYKVDVSALDADGKTVQQRTFPLEIKDWPWLNNELGEKPRVLPPWTPMEVHGRDGPEISCWGRTYRFGETGLPENIRTLGQDLLLARPLLWGQVSGQVVAKPEVKDAYHITDRAPHMVKGTASLDFGGIPVKLSTEMEYDGWLVYTLELGGAPGKELQQLDLVFSFGPEATLYHVVGERHTDTLAGEIPPGDGVVWDSRTPRNMDILGTFQPYVWVGNETRGLSWMAESDRGWHTADDRPCIDLFRYPAAVDEAGRTIRQERIQLRFHLVNLPTKMDQPRRIVFGIMATPCKPRPADWRRWTLWDPGSPRRATKVFSIDFGREWQHGFGGGFYPRDHDYSLVKFPQVHMARGENYPTFYTGFGYIAMNYPEVQYFRSEWLGKDFTTYSAIDRFANHKIYGDDSRAYVTGGAALTESFQDFACWCYDKLFTETAFRAIYYDLFNPGFTDRLDMGAYIRDDGQLQKANNLFRKRRFLQRVAYLMHDRGLEPLAIVHMTGTAMEPALSFANLTLDAEMRFPPPGRDHMDVWPFDLLRAESMGSQYGMVPLFLQGGGRDLVGMLAAHDMIECRGTNRGCVSHEYQAVLADFGVAVGNDDVTFTGYWSGAVSTGEANVLCSYYRRPGKAFLIVVNRDGLAKTVSLTFAPKALGLAPDAKATDPQRKEPLAVQPGKKDQLAIPLAVPRHDYRVVVLE